MPIDGQPMDAFYGAAAKMAGQTRQSRIMWRSSLMGTFGSWMRMEVIRGSLRIVSGRMGCRCICRMNCYRNIVLSTSGIKTHNDASISVVLLEGLYLSKPRGRGLASRCPSVELCDGVAST